MGSELSLGPGSVFVSGVGCRWFFFLLLLSFACASVLLWFSCLLFWWFLLWLCVFVAKTSGTFVQAGSVFLLLALGPVVAVLLALV